MVAILKQHIALRTASSALAAGALVLTLALVPGCAKKAGGAGGGFAMPPTPVETATVSPRSVIDRFETVGTIEAGEAVTIVAEIDGTVESIPFHEGDTIARGGLIARMDDRQLAADRDRAEAIRDQGRSTFARVKAVVDQGAGAPQDLDDAAANLKVAEANLALAEARLDKARVTAPFSGIIGARRISPGAYLRTGDAITDLAQIEEIRVTFSAPERYLGKLQQGSTVQVSTTAYPGYALEGVINVIDPVLDPGTRSARVVARAKNPEGKFRPGMSANITTVLAQREGALTVPSEAVVVEGNQAFVYVVNADSSVVRTPLTLGTRMSDAVEVVDGVTAGTVVVRAGHQKLYPGAKVMPVQSGAAPSGGAPAAEGARP